jgi:L-ascorbate metabolism protein UlaG (beta-lactamase superfamily)
MLAFISRRLLFLVIIWLAVPLPVSAQQRQPSTCLAIAKAPTIEQLLVHAAWPADGFNFAQANSPDVTIRYITHSTFRIESPGGIVIATDFADRAGSGPVPDIVTMNHAHGTHFTMMPPAEIAHVLRGWGTDGNPASHYLELGDTLTRNVTTDIYRGGVLVEANGNSVFVFEIAGLCIGHVGHLHHTLTPEHYAAIGRLDVLMLPVDGYMTMSIEGMSNLARNFRSSVILPMHWFSGYSLQRFIDNVSATFAVDNRRESAMKLSLASLPGSPTVVVLQPELGNGNRFGIDNN